MMISGSVEKERWLRVLFDCDTPPVKCHALHVMRSMPYPIVPQRHRKSDTYHTPSSDCASTGVRSQLGL